MPITCIANNGSNGETEVPLWECPCAACTRMDWEALDDDRPTLAQHRHDGFPEAWDAYGYAEGSAAQAEAAARRTVAYVNARIVIMADGTVKAVRS